MKRRNRKSKRIFKGMDNQCIFISLNGIQIDIQRPFDNTSLIELLSVALREEKPVSGSYTETQTRLINILHRQIQDVNRLVRALDTKTPIRLRKHPPELVDSLRYQTETLTELLSAHVLPLLERINSNRK